MKSSYRGYSTLVAVVLLLAFMTIVILGINALGITSLQSGYQANTSSQKLQQSESCIEEVLRRLKDNAGYTGGTVTLSPTLSCTASINGTETQKTITTTVIMANITKIITITLNILIDGSSRNFQITSWSEQ